MANHLAELDHLRNRYFALRHGESLANEAGIIMSDPEEGTRSNGLTATGREQVQRALRTIRETGVFAEPPIIYCSDFMRARESAEIAASVLGSSYTLTPRLRERFFGEWEGTSNANYHAVWANDATDPDHHRQGVESTTQVIERTTALIADLEALYGGRDILLVSHGDTLQILQTAFWRVAPAYHRRLPHLGLAELRELEWLCHSILG